jgi:hypothetical protein
MYNNEKKKKEKVFCFILFYFLLFSSFSVDIDGDMTQAPRAPQARALCRPACGPPMQTHSTTTSQKWLGWVCILQYTAPYLYVLITPA